MPGKKPTSEDLDDRVEAVIDMLAKAWSFGEIKRGLRSQYGPLGLRTCARYVARARATMIKDSNRTKQDWQAHHIAIYYGIVRDTNASASARVQALSRIDSMLGLDAPKGSDGPKVETDQQRHDRLVKECNFKPGEVERFARMCQEEDFDGVEPGEYMPDKPGNSPESHEKDAPRTDSKRTAPPPELNGE